MGLPRPGYHVVRELAARTRASRAARAATYRAAVDVVGALASPYVVTTREALERLAEAKGRERFVLDQHKLARLARLEDESLWEDDP